MGGGPLNNNHNNIPMVDSPQQQLLRKQEQFKKQQEQQAQQELLLEQRQQLQEQEQQQYNTELNEQSKRRQQYNKRSSYNPFLTPQPTWSSSSHSSIASVYPTYDPNDFQVVPIQLTPPQLPPIPTAYRTPPPPPPLPQAALFTIPPLPSRNFTVPTEPPPPPRLAENIELTPVPTTSTTNQVRLIYAKSGFYLKSTNPMESNQSIHGFLSIFSKSMDDVDILLAWIPEYLIEAQDIPTFIQLDGVLAAEQGFPTVHLNMGERETMTISMKNVYSLYVCPPSSAAQGSIVITSRSGDVMKPIWYAAAQDIEEDGNSQSDIGTWPGYDIIDIISAFHPMQSSAEMEHVHLVEPVVAHSIAASSIEEMPSPVPKPASILIQQPIGEDHSDPIVTALREARWSLLEQLSKITQYSRDTAAQVLEHARPLLPGVLGGSTAAQETLSEYQMASQYVAQWGTHAAQNDDYHLADDTDGLLHGMPELCGPTPIHTRRAPVSPEEWVGFFDNEGKLNVSVDHINELVFRGGLHADIRIEAWKFLLGIYPWDSTSDEREAIRRSRAEHYYSIKAKWFDNMEIRNTKEFQDEKHRIDKDVHRTDRNQEAFVGDELPNPDPAMCVGTNANLEIMKDILVTYNFHNTDLGYVQGMSDLLAPLFVAMGDEPMAFWGFSLFMDRVQSNFYLDQSGMHGQLKTLDSLIRFMDPALYKRLEDTDTSNLFFCFRWLLVWFKREFEWEDVIRLWEVLWTNHLSDKMILFIALAVIDAHREKILKDLNEFDQVLRYINDLTGHIPLEPTLERAEVLFYQFERKIRAMQHKKTLLKDQLQIRSVWNSSERVKIQERIEKLNIPENLLSLLPSPAQS